MLAWSLNYDKILGNNEKNFFPDYLKYNSKNTRYLDFKNKFI